MRTLLLILLMIGAVLLEMYLSRKPSRWPGLVLPITAFVISLIYPLNMANLGGDMAALIAQVLLVWLLANIPTFVLLAIYFAARSRMRRTREQNRMSAKDLHTQLRRDTQRPRCRNSIKEAGLKTGFF